MLATYPLSRSLQAFRARKIYIWYFLVPMLFSGGLIPWYFIVKSTGIYDTIWALILPGAVPVFNVILLMNFFRELPKEIEESAYVDGAGHLITLLRIHIPLSKAALATLVLFCFVNHWNSWFDGLILMRSKDSYPMQTYLQTMLTVPDLSKSSSEEIIEFFKVNLRSIRLPRYLCLDDSHFRYLPAAAEVFCQRRCFGSGQGLMS